MIWDDSMVDLETWMRVVHKKLELPNGKIVPNRIMRAATWMGQAEQDGTCGDTIIETYGKIRAGVVVTGFQSVMKNRNGAFRHGLMTPSSGGN